MKLSLFLLLLTSCATGQFIKHDYLVSTRQGTFLCDTYEHTAYGAAAKDCEHILMGYTVDLIPNPIKVTTVKE